jgi:hypothetical protein
MLQIAAFACVAAYLQVDQAGKQGVVAADVSLEQLMAGYIQPLLPAGWSSQATAAAQFMSTALGASGDRLANMPLRTLLPHASYALSAAAAIAWLAQLAMRRLHGAAAGTSLARLLLALLLLVSDRQTPLMLLLGLLQLTAITKLLSQRAKLRPCGANASGVAGEAAALVTLISAQLFYVTGHLCEFAGLQYTAG